MSPKDYLELDRKHDAIFKTAFATIFGGSMVTAMVNALVMARFGGDPTLLVTPWFLFSIAFAGMGMFIFYDFIFETRNVKLTLALRKYLNTIDSLPEDKWKGMNSEKYEIGDGYEILIFQKHCDKPAWSLFWKGDCVICSFAGSFLFKRIRNSVGQRIEELKGKVELN